MSKQTIIIDKNIFQASSLENLSRLAGEHCIILPNILLEECLTTQRYPGAQTLLEKAEALIKAGAYVSFSQKRMLDIEKESLQPLCSAIDEAATKQVRDNTMKGIQLDIEKEAEECTKCFTPLLQFVEELTRAFWKTLSAKEYSADWRNPGDDNERVKRLIKWRLATCIQMKPWIELQYPSIAAHITRDWVTWYFFQFLIVYGIEWAFKRNQSGQNYENFNITNDVYDLNYLSCLYLSDGLMSNDRDLQELASTLTPKGSLHPGIRCIAGEMKRCSVHF